MKTKSGGKTKTWPLMTAFWDTSALVPLCCFQPQSAQARQAARTYRRQVVWWGTAIEAVSSLNWLTRGGALDAKESRQAFARLDYLRNRWNEVQPTEEVRDRAERLLRVHKLRAADALQLAAALVWCGNRPQGRTLIGADGILSEAADAEGFTVIYL
jgi:predicted nucleic acid-binding protein